MRPHISNSLLVIIATALVALAAISSAARTGQWSEIKDLSDPTVKEIAGFAVSEYNKQSHQSLTLKKIVKGESQVVAGTNYRLLLAAAASGGALNKYEAIVWDKPWQHFRNLTSFKLAS